MYEQKTLTHTNTVTDHLNASIHVTKLMLNRIDDILSATELLFQSLSSGGKVMLCGNGGSAADCLHFAAELVHRLSSDFDHPALPAIALTSNVAAITAYANDVDYEGIFSRQVEAFGKPGDSLICISTSGNSKNVVRAARTARGRNIHVIALTGRGGILSDLSDATIAVPTEQTQHIQETLLVVEHIVCGLLETMLFKNGQ